MIIQMILSKVGKTGNFDLKTVQPILFNTDTRGFERNVFNALLRQLPQNPMQGHAVRGRQGFDVFRGIGNNADRSDTG